jgi:hypothetical protein
MATVLSIIAYDEFAPEGQGEVVSLVLRPGLPTSNTVAIALHLAQIAHQIGSRPALPGPMNPANLGPVSDATVPLGGRGKA